jgi:hypothetical protein
MLVNGRNDGGRICSQVPVVLGLAQGLNSNSLEARHSVRQCPIPHYTALDCISRAHGNAPCHATISCGHTKKKKKYMHLLRPSLLVTGTLPYYLCVWCVCIIIHCVDVCVVLSHGHNYTAVIHYTIPSRIPVYANTTKFVLYDEQFVDTSPPSTIAHHRQPFHHHRRSLSRIFACWEDILLQCPTSLPFLTEPSTAPAFV